jgi:hypothetical protein
MDASHSIAIPVGFIILSGLIAWHLAYAKGPWTLKLAFIVIICGFGLEVSKALDSYAGWPTREETPDEAIFLDADIHEPNKILNQPGEIYVWLKPLEPAASGIFKEDPPPDAPRAFRLDYSRKSHEELQGAMERVRKGQIVGFRHHGRRRGRGNGNGRGDGPGGDGDDSGSEDDDDVHTYDLPPAQPPHKDPETPHQAPDATTGASAR